MGGIGSERLKKAAAGGGPPVVSFRQEKMMINRRVAIACAFAALLSGCASTRQHMTTTSVAPTIGPVDLARRSPRDPALLFATPEMRQMLAERGLPAGFGWEDWEYGRNDERLSVGAPPARTGFRAFEITQYDRLYDYNGRPRNSTQTTTRSVRSGAAR